MCVISHPYLILLFNSSLEECFILPGKYPSVVRSLTTDYNVCRKKSSYFQGFLNLYAIHFKYKKNIDFWAPSSRVR